MQNHPHILYVTNGLHGGGAERLLTNIAIQQRERHRVSVVSLTPDGVFRRTLEEAGVSVTELGMHSSRHALRGVIALAKLIRADRPAAVYGWMYHANLLAMFALLLAGISGVRLFWGVFCTETVGGLKFSLVRRANVFFSRWVDGVVYNAVEARDHHHAIGFREPRSIVISNCVDPVAFRHDPDERGAVRRELGIGPDEVVVAVVARVDPMKDWNTVLAAVRALPGVVTIAIGKGTDHLPSQPGFRGLGWRDDVVRILSSADVFLLASAFGEGTSLALAEAMQCGLPCVVTAVGGNAVLAGDGGIVVAPRDVAALRRAILDLANDPERRHRLGSNAQLRALSFASSEDTLRALQLLHEVPA
jgi:glycosyltransferase involved in cell wall biosynthesis